MRAEVADASRWPFGILHKPARLVSSTATAQRRNIPSCRAAHVGRIRCADTERTPDIRSVSAVGHTPGHSGYLVSSGAAQLLHRRHTACGAGAVCTARRDDDVRLPPRRRPRPAAGLDRARAVKVDLLIGAVHLPFPAIGKLRRAEVGGCAYEPLPWQLY